MIKLHVFFSLEIFQCSVDDNSESGSKQIGTQTCVKGQTYRGTSIDTFRHTQHYKSHSLQLEMLRITFPENR